MKPSKEQLEIAKKFNIPRAQACFINLEKAKAYEEYLSSQKGKDEEFLERLRCERNEM